MKLLLTSAGLANKTIVNALFEMVGKKPEDTSIVFIPTASTTISGDRSWVDEDLENLKSFGFKSIKSADISTSDISVWKLIFEEADVLFFEGGSDFYLMEWINKSGLRDLLPKLLETKVWLGVSAGSMVTTKSLQVNISHELYEEELEKTEDMQAIGLVDFYFFPHLNSRYFTKVKKENIEKAISGMAEKIYCMDDNGAVKVVDGNVEIVTEGEYLEFN